MLVETLTHMKKHKTCAQGVNNLLRITITFVGEKSMHQRCIVLESSDVCCFRNKSLNSLNAEATVSFKRVHEQTIQNHPMGCPIQA